MAPHLELRQISKRTYTKQEPVRRQVLGQGRRAEKGEPGLASWEPRPPPERTNPHTVGVGGERQKRVPSLWASRLAHPFPAQALLPQFPDLEGGGHSL